MVKRIFVDMVKVLVLIGLVGYGLFVMDAGNIAVFQALLIAVFLAGGTHLTRRILFHRLDLQQIAMVAVRENNMAAAIVFASIVGFLVAVMYLSMSVLK